MKYARELVVNTVIGGALVLVPIYLAVLLLLKGMQSVVGLVRPVAALLPDWVPGETFWTLLIVLWKSSRLRAVSQPDAADGGGG